MRRTMVGILTLALTCWHGTAGVASATSCASVPEPSLESFARGTPLGWQDQRADSYVLVLGAVVGRQPWHDPTDRSLPPGWELLVEVTAAVGIASVPASISLVHFGDAAQDFHERRAFVSVEQNGTRYTWSHCLPEFGVHDVDTTADHLEAIAVENGTPFARPGARPDTAWAQALMVGGTLAVVGILDAVRRRLAGVIAPPWSG